MEEIQRRLGLLPVVGIIGARQVGKTTLAMQTRESTTGPATHLDLEKPSDLARPPEPQLAPESLSGLVIRADCTRSAATTRASTEAEDSISGFPARVSAPR